MGTKKSRQAAPTRGQHGASPAVPTRGGKADFEYDLFICYARNPDAAVAREIERFLEAFHSALAETKGTMPIKALRVCLDGSDFILQGWDGEEAPTVTKRGADATLSHYLDRSRELLVLCSTGSARSDYMAKEIRHFMEHRGTGRIRLAYTDGTDPDRRSNPEQFFPAPVIERGLHQDLAYDLRGYDGRRAREWGATTDFHRELVKLAADLLGYSAGDLLPTWITAELERTRSTSLNMVSAARFETLLGDPGQAMLRAWRAHGVHPTPESEASLRDAYKVTVLHHQNRREISQISGDGPRYLAGRWKQGEVFVKTSPDGRYRLLVTERGRDGPHPSGDVFLISNETLRAIKLEPPNDNCNYRVEEVGFDRETRHIFVTRYFNLSVYALNGRRIGGYAFSRHTKSPVHLVAAYFAGNYIIGAETKGGVWLVDPEGDAKSTLTVHGEFYRDTTLAVQLSGTGQLAALVYESTRADLLTLNAVGAVCLKEVAPRGILYAGFPARTDERLFTAGEDGMVRIYELENHGTRLNEELSTPPQPSALDWVSLSVDGREMLAVGEDQTIYIFSAESGDLRGTFNFSDEIDWTAARAAVVPQKTPTPAPIDLSGKATPFPPRDVGVERVRALPSGAWIFTTTWKDDPYLLPDWMAWKLDASGMLPLVKDVADVTQHGDLLWFHSQFGSGGPAVLCCGGKLERYPNDGIDVTAVMEIDGQLWVGTSQGAYLRDPDGDRLICPQHVKVHEILHLGGRTWLRTKQGAYVVEAAGLIRLTENFFDVQQIIEAGGSIWLRGKTEHASGGPAHRVDGCFTRLLPHRRARVVRILEADRAAWLVEQNQIHRIAGETVRTTEGFATYVTALVDAGPEIWATTNTRGLYPSNGPLYRIDAATLAVREEPRFSGAVLLRAGGSSFLRHTDSTGRGHVAVLTEDGPREIGIDAACVQDLISVAGEPWLLTEAGAWRIENGIAEPVDCPRIPILDVQLVLGRIWLMSPGCAVRLEPEGPLVFATGGFIPHAVEIVDGEAWILTKQPPADNVNWFAPQVLLKPGPAFQVRESGVVERRAVDGGVTGVVKLGDRTWVLTAKNGRAGLPQAVADKPKKRRPATSSKHSPERDERTMRARH